MSIKAQHNPRDTFWSGSCVNTISETTSARASSNAGEVWPASARSLSPVPTQVPCLTCLTQAGSGTQLQTLPGAGGLQAAHPQPIPPGCQSSHLLISKINSTMINVIIYSTHDQNHCFCRPQGNKLQSRGDLFPPAG